MIDQVAYSLSWTEGEPEAEEMTETSAPLSASFPALPTLAPSRIYARHPGLRPFLTAKLPEAALWKTVPPRRVFAVPERSSFWWGGNGLVDRTAIVRVLEGWNPYAAGTRLPLHVFEAGVLLAPGERLRLTWTETSVTPDGPQTVRCLGWLNNEDGQAHTTLASRIPEARR